MAVKWLNKLTGKYETDAETITPTPVTWSSDAESPDAKRLLLALSIVSGRVTDIDSAQYALLWEEAADFVGHMEVGEAGKGRAERIVFSAIYQASMPLVVLSVPEE